MTIRRHGGFRSRLRIQQARAVWSLVRSIPAMVRFDLPEHFAGSVAWQSRMDRMDACPHLPWMHRSSTPGWVDCEEREGGCGRCLKSPNGWLVECERTPDDGFSNERKHARPGWQERYRAKGIHVPEGV